MLIERKTRPVNKISQSMARQQEDMYFGLLNQYDVVIAMESIVGAHGS